jgi:hypothetical protein
VVLCRLFGHEHLPKDKPRQTKQPGRDKGRLPAERNCHDSDYWAGDGAAQRCAAEGDPNGAGRLAMRKPIMDDLIICGRKRTFAHAEDDANN